MARPQDFFGKQYDLLNSPVLLGTPSAPTAAPGTNSPQLATTEFSNIADNTLITGRKNYLINGDFQIWQRGTSFNVTGYTADRWKMYVDSDASCTATRHNEIIPTANDGLAYPLKLVTAGGTTTTSRVMIAQGIESVWSCSGKYVTVSFWYWSNQPIAIEFQQIFDSAEANIYSIGAQVIPSSNSAWAKFVSAPIYIPNVYGKTLGAKHCLLFELWTSAGSGHNARTANLGIQSGTVYLLNIQIEEGNFGTSFDKRPISEEFMMCRRYYQYYPRIELFLRFQTPTTSLGRLNQVDLIPHMRAIPVINGDVGVYFMSVITHGLSTTQYTPWGNASTSADYTYVGNVRLDAEII